MWEGVLPHLLTSSYAMESCTADHTWTGLKMYWTDLPTTDGSNFIWPRKTYFLGGTGDFKGMDRMYTYCVANHTGQPPSQGWEAILKQPLTLSEYAKFSGNMSMDYGANADEMRKFTFCLAAVAAIAPGQQSTSDLKSKVSSWILWPSLSFLRLREEWGWMPGS